LPRHVPTLFLAVLGVVACAADMSAAPRDPAQSARPARVPQQPSATVPQTEPMDLDEGKTPQQMFSNACSVCHQSAQGLAKGRSAGQLGSFLRQHYTTGTGQANSLASFLTSGGNDRGTPTPVRGAPGDKPEKPADPAAASRKPKPEETRGKPEPAVAATNPQRRIRNEDGTTQPVDGLVVLPPGASEIPDEGERRRETRPESAPPATRQRQPRPSDVKPAETKPAEPAKPVEVAKPAEPEPAPVKVEAPRPPRDPAAAHSGLTEERPKPAPSDVQEIPL
jgi:hypothetical protein